MDTTPKHHTDDNLHAAAADLETIGRTWASYGIRLGVAALQTSAISVGQVANLLGHVADELGTSRITARKEPPARD